MYEKNPGWEWENAVSGAATGIIGITLVLLAAVLLTIAIVLLREIVRIYMARAFNAELATARALWIALAVFLGLVVLALTPFLAGIAPYLLAWGFLGFVIFVEGCDLYEQQQESLGAGSDGLLLGANMP